MSQTTREKCHIWTDEAIAEVLWAKKLFKKREEKLLPGTPKVAHSFIEWLLTVSTDTSAYRPRT